jgi:hypothetical protein
MRFKPLIQQVAQRCRRFRLTFGRDLVNKCLDGSLYQHAKDGVWVNADRAGHGDRLGEDVERVRPAGGNALDPADQRIDGWVGSVWHCVSMAGDACVMQGCRVCQHSWRSGQAASVGNQQVQGQANPAVGYVIRAD